MSINPRVGFIGCGILKFIYGVNVFELYWGCHIVVKCHARNINIRIFDFDGHIWFLGGCHGLSLGLEYLHLDVALGDIDRNYPFYNTTK